MTTIYPAIRRMIRTAKLRRRRRVRLSGRVCGPLLLTVWLLVGLSAVRAAPLPQQDLILAYRVYVFGLPTWFDATVHVKFAGERVLMSSELNSWIFSNSHQTEFPLPTVAIAQKDIAIVGLARVGVSMTRCSTTGEITWRVIKGICSALAKTKRPIKNWNTR